MHKHLKPEDHRVVVLGASPKPTRYSFQAVQMLASAGYQVIPVHPKAHRIERIAVVANLRAVRPPVHTLTVYVGEERSRTMIDDILALVPGRVIFNPGSESRELENALSDARIPHERACTLVLLRSRQF
jgi:predicted CoA-binding protein